jgi:hypothetical protein
MMFNILQLYVATSPKLAGVSGKYFVPIAVETMPSFLAQNETLQKLLWDESEKLIRPYL